MPQINESITINADPGRVWAVAGDPATISEWLPAIASSSVDGERRSCRTVDGADLHERIVEQSDEGRFYVYEITDSPMPISAYRSRLAVSGHGDHSHVTWAAELEPAEGGDAAELEATFSQIYRDGLESVRSRVEGS